MKKCYMVVSILVRQVEDLLTERTHVVHSYADIACAICKLVPAVAKEYFLTYPNLHTVDHVADTIDSLYDNVLLTQSYPTYWHRTIIRVISEYLKSHFSEWDLVTWRYDRGVFDFVNHGDYRIRYFNTHHGNCRVGEPVELPDDTKPVVENITDPFYVSDSIPPELQSDVIALEPTERRIRSMQAFSDSKYLIDVDTKHVPKSSPKKHTRLPDAVLLKDWDFAETFGLLNTSSGGADVQSDNINKLLRDYWDNWDSGRPA